MKLCNGHDSKSGDLNVLPDQPDAVRTVRRDGTTQLLKLPGVLAGLLIVLMLAAGCGGDGDDLESSFDEIAASEDTRRTEAFVILESYFDEIAASEDTRRREAFALISVPGVRGQIAFFDVLIPILESESARLADIEAPGAVALDHAEYVELRSEVLRATQTIADRLAEILTKPIPQHLALLNELASDPALGYAGLTNYGQSASAACQRLGEAATAEGLDGPICNNLGMFDDAPVAVVTAASCGGLSDVFGNAGSTNTLFMNSTDHVLRIFSFGSQVHLAELQPGEIESRPSPVGTRFRAEDEAGACVGIYNSAFPPERAEFTGE